MGKQKILLVLSLLMMMAMSFNSLSAYAASNDNAHKKSDLGCNCTHTHIKKTTQLRNPYIRKGIMQKVLTAYKNNHSIYKKADFKWNKAVRNYYGKGISSIQVPLKADAKSSTKKIYLNVFYNSKHKDFGHYTVMTLTRKNTHTNAFTMSVGLMDGTKVAGIRYDANGKGTPFMYQQKQSNGVVIQPMGYWQNVQWCIENSWHTLPGWVKWVCSAACGGCLFGSPYGCGACAGCLAGYGLGCAASQL